ncbi:hypothetical protein D9M68_738570 [compost metagenome]
MVRCLGSGDFLQQAGLECIFHIVLQHHLARAIGRQFTQVDPQLRRQLTRRRPCTKIAGGRCAFRHRRDRSRRLADQQSLDIGHRHPATTTGAGQCSQFDLVTVGQATRHRAGIHLFVTLDQRLRINLRRIR